MSVNWLWKNKLGYMRYHVTWKGEEYNVKTILYTANCLGCEIYHDDKTHYTFQGFWNDEQHLKNTLGLNKEYQDDLYSKEYSPNRYLIEIGLNTYFYDNAMKIAKYFAKKHYKITLYYKEIK